MSAYPSVYQAKDYINRHIGYWFFDKGQDYEEFINNLRNEIGDDFSDENSGFIEIENS